jgi:hypothetical protein
VQSNTRESAVVQAYELGYGKSVAVIPTIV